MADRGASLTVPSTHERILGVSFFSGSVRDAVERARHAGGLIAIPASPALLKLKYDEEYRLVLQRADLVLADSELLALLWKLVSGRRLKKISGISYLKCLLADIEHPIPEWAERFHVGWLSRLMSQPRMFLPRIGIAFALAGMVFKYRSEMPRLKTRWADV